MHAELPVASFVCVVLSLAPLPWHWRAGTVPTISLSIWLFLSNLINGVNSIIWAGNVKLVAIVWCDIATKIFMGANIALSASIFCLCIHLERVSSIRQVRTTLMQKRRRQIIDCLICTGIPIIYMALHYIVQGHRFDIVQEFGCRPYTYVSWPSIIIIWIPPLLFCVASLILSALAFRNFWTRRITFARHLQNSNSALTPSRYFRLMSMSVVQMFWGLLVISLNMWFTLRNGLRPWTGWDDVHYNFSRVGLFPTIFIPKLDFALTYALWWSVPISTVLFFAFFAFGQEAMKEYSACLSWIRRTIIHVPQKPSVAKDLIHLPNHVPGSIINLPSLTYHNPDDSTVESKSKASFVYSGQAALGVSATTVPSSPSISEVTSSRCPSPSDLDANNGHDTPNVPYGSHAV